MVEVLIRREEETSKKFGKFPDKRTIEEHIKLGIINVDKPAGPTSHQVSAYVKDILGINKAGHSGTLDPNVTGVLAVGLEKSTKIIQYLLKAGKEYVCLMHLHKPVEEYKIYQVFEEFTGRIKQMPPIKSSVKRQWRYRNVYYIDVLQIKDQDVLFTVGCEAGTYIRKLVHDIGQKLKVGAHMAELRRTKAGPFSEEKSVTLQDLTDAFYYYKKYGKEKFLRKVIEPVEAGVLHLKKIWVLDTTVDSLCHGAQLAIPGISKLDSDIEKGDSVAVLTLKDELICIGDSVSSSNIMLGNKGLAVKTDKVVMEPGVYPRI